MKLTAETRQSIIRLRKIIEEKTGIFSNVDLNPIIYSILSNDVEEEKNIKLKIINPINFEMTEEAGKIIIHAMERELKDIFGINKNEVLTNEERESIISNTDAKTYMAMLRYKNIYINIIQDDDLYTLYFDKLLITVEKIKEHINKYMSVYTIFDFIYDKMKETFEPDDSNDVNTYVDNFTGVAGCIKFAALDIIQKVIYDIPPVSAKAYAKLVELAARKVNEKHPNIDYNNAYIDILDEMGNVANDKNTVQAEKSTVDDFDTIDNRIKYVALSIMEYAKKIVSADNIDDFNTRVKKAATEFNKKDIPDETTYLELLLNMTNYLFKQNLKNFHKVPAKSKEYENLFAEEAFIGSAIDATEQFIKLNDNVKNDKIKATVHDYIFYMTKKPTISYNGLYKFIKNLVNAAIKFEKSGEEFKHGYQILIYMYID